MAYGFFDWIRNKGWRSAGRYKPFTLPKNATDRQIRAAIELLLDKDRACEARPALHALRERAAPLIEQAVVEARFRYSLEWPSHCASTAFEMLLEILDAAGSPTPLGEAEQLVEDPAWQRRRVAARYLTRTGKMRYAPVVIKLLHDPDNLVRSQVIERLVEGAATARLEAALAAELYSIMRSWAFRRDKGEGAEAAKLMLMFDRSRAAAELTSAAAFDLRLNWLYRNLTALREVGVAAPPHALLRVLEESLARYDNEPDRSEAGRWPSIATSCMQSLAHQKHDRIDDVLERLVEHQDEWIRNEASELQLSRADVDPDKSVFGTLERRGFEGLSDAQQKYLVVTELDGEVRNGGFLQYFSNSYGAHVNIARQALNEVGAHASAHIVADAVKLFGPSGVPTDRDARNEALTRLLPRDESPFEDHDTRWYADEDHLRVRLQKFVLLHRNDFKA